MCGGYCEEELTVAEVKWYERGEIGESLRDLLDFEEYEEFIALGTQLGMSEEDILEVLLKHEEIV